MSQSQPGPSRPRPKAPKPVGKWRTLKPRSEMTDDDYRSEFREKFGELKKSIAGAFDTYLSEVGVSDSRVKSIRDVLFGNTSPLFPCQDRLRHDVKYLTDIQVNRLCQIVGIYHQLLNKNPYWTYIEGPQKRYYIYAYPERSNEILTVTPEMNRNSNFRAAMLKSVGSANETYNVARKLVRRAIGIANRHLGDENSDDLIYDSDSD